MSIVLWPAEMCTIPSEGGQPLLPPGWVQAIRSEAGRFEVVTPASEAEALAAAPSAEGWIGALTPQLLAAAPRLRWLQSPLIGIHLIMFRELAESNVTACNMLFISSDFIANHVLAMFLALCHELPYLMRRQIAHDWVNRPDVARKVRVGDPAQMTVLIVGVGSIGNELVRRFGPLGCTIIGIDPNVSSPPTGVSEIARPDRLVEFLGRAHAVIVCTPLTTETNGLFDETMFKAMRRDAVFMNRGPGQIVKLAALERALKEGWIAGAGMDAFETQPLPNESPLWEMENVIVTPHVATMGRASQDRRLEVVLANLRRFVAGQALENVIDKTAWRAH